MPKVQRNRKHTNASTETGEEILYPAHKLNMFRVKNADVQEEFTSRTIEYDKDGQKVLVIRGYKSQKDRSKRLVKQPGVVDPTNIVTGTRKRKNINYKEIKDGVYTESKTHKKSKNTQEARLKSPTKKKRASRSTKKDDENVDPQFEQDEQVEEAKFAKKSRSGKKGSKKQVKQEQEPEAMEDEQEQEEKWIYPVSRQVVEAVGKLGCAIPEAVKKRRYRDQLLADAVNFFVSIQFPSKLYRINPKLVGGEEVSNIEHGLFELDASENEIKFLEQNPDAILLAEGDGIIAVKPAETNCADFNLYIILEAVDENPETVHTVTLSQYLAGLEPVAEETPAEQ